MSLANRPTRTTTALGSMRLALGQHFFVACRPFAGLICIAVIGCLGPSVLGFAGLHADQADVMASLQPPSRHHWFGTDEIGRDLLIRVVAATRLDLMMALSAVLLSALCGGMLGAASAWCGGTVDRLFQRVVDVAMAFPLFVVALTLAAVLGNGAGSVVLATALINIPFFARLTRTEIAQRRALPYVDAARLDGWSSVRILFCILLPNSLPSLIAHATTNIGWAMLNGASLSFVGMGVRPPAAEWGTLIADGASAFIGGQWWLVTFPALALFLTVLIVNQAGHALRARFVPGAQP
ncbi:ABC transporter permease [Robbsia andropogonis]|uniref:ABC transporter permease n=1 Tax=Robbsia andropogonis TaxID=28092 RepID=UPI000465F820|nr:ABC transporter permease [Robbsia andropogonis]